MGKKSKKTTQSLDLFGKDGKPTSLLCLLLAFLIIVIAVLLAVWIGIRSLDRQKPSIVQYELSPNEYNPTINWNTDDLKFGLLFLGLTGFEQYFISYDWTYVGPNEVVPLQMKNDCKFDIVPDKNFKCFDQIESSKGSTYLDTQESWSLTLYYRSCWFAHPDGSGCFDQPTIEAVVKNTMKAALVYEDVVVDPYNHENPLSTIETAASAFVWADVGTTIVLELNEIEFTTDNGWIFEDLKTETKLKVTKSLKASDEMLKVQLLYGGKKTVYKRTYPKVQDCLAQISGFVAIIIPMLLILGSSFGTGHRQALQHMINEIYEIKLKKPNNNKDGGDSPQKTGGKKKRRPSKSNAFPTTGPTGAGTERNLLSQETISKFKNRTRPPQLNQNDVILAIGGLDNSNNANNPDNSNNPENLIKLPTKDDISQIPEENIEPFGFDSLRKSPSSPLRSALVSPRHEESKLLPTTLTTSLGQAPTKKQENGRLNENLEPIDTNRQETGNRSLAEEAEESESEEEVEEVEEEEIEEEVTLRTSDSLKVPWYHWLKSIWMPTPEVQVMKKAKEHIMETFDLVALSKKIIEIDKLKACLLTREQRVIFENLPSSVIVLNPDIDAKSPEAVKQYHWKESFKGDETAIREAYSKLKETKNELNKLLLKLYESEYIGDGLSS